MAELTFGQQAVGLDFNPSGEDKVAKAKQLFAEAIDLLEDAHNTYTNNGKSVTSWTRNVFRTAAFNAIITAQMSLVKYLTWKF